MLNVHKVQMKLRLKKKKERKRKKKEKKTGTFLENSGQIFALDFFEEYFLQKQSILLTNSSFKIQFSAVF